MSGARAKILAAALALAAAPAAARADEPPAARFAVDDFHPAPAGDRFFRLESPELLGHGAYDIALVTDLALSPFRVERPDANGRPASVAVVTTQLWFHPGFAVTLWDRWKLSVDVPLGMSSVADDIEIPSEATTTTWGIGDVRTALRLRLGGLPGDPFIASLAGHVWYPTGDPEDFTGDHAVRGSPRIVLGGKVDRFTWGSSGGPVFRPRAEAAGTTVDTQFLLDTGVALAFSGMLTLTIEGHGAFVVSGEDALSRHTSNLELLLGWRLRFDDAVVGPAVAVGLPAGAGTPFLRALFTITYAPLERIGADPYGDGDDDDYPVPPRPPPIVDSDRDGLEDPYDACPHAGGPRGGPAGDGCPDADGDGVADPADACPTRAGPRPASEDGCPRADRDGDGIVDRDDACPDLAGAPNESPRDHGCPSDRDGDGALDAEDACPDAKGRFSPYPERHGCPPEPKPAP